MKTKEQIEQLEKRVKDLEFFAGIVFQGLIGARQFLVTHIKEASNAPKEESKTE